MLTILSQKAYMLAKATFMVKTQTTWRKIPQCNECLQIWHRRQQAKVQAGKEAGGQGRPPPVARIAMLSLSCQRMIFEDSIVSLLPLVQVCQGLLPVSWNLCMLHSGA